MPRIQPDQNPSAEAQEKLDAVKQKLGSVPNIFQTFAHSPAVLNFYLAGSDALKGTSISGALREQIALVVAGQNACDYCASAHTAIAKGEGVAADEASQNLEGKSSDAKTQAALDFARKLVETRAHIQDSDLQELKEAGYSEAEALEIVTVVAFNIFTNYFNHVADTEVDFPHVSTENVKRAA